MVRMTALGPVMVSPTAFESPPLASPRVKCVWGDMIRHTFCIPTEPWVMGFLSSAPARHVRNYAEAPGSMRAQGPSGCARQIRWHRARSRSGRASRTRSIAAYARRTSFAGGGSTSSRSYSGSGEVSTGPVSSLGLRVEMPGMSSLALGIGGRGVCIQRHLGGQDWAGKSELRWYVCVTGMDRTVKVWSRLVNKLEAKLWRRGGMGLLGLMPFVARSCPEQ